MNKANVLPTTTTAVRWGARMLSALILLFWGYFIVLHLVSDAGRASRPLVANDYLSLIAMIVSVVGLGVAWKWERVGAAITLVAVCVGAMINWKVLVFPMILIPFTAGLFLLVGWTRRA